MNLAELLEWKPSVESEVRRILGRLLREGHRWSPALDPFVERVQEFTLRGGKRFRALLLLAGYHLGGGRDPSRALPAAAALEAFQSWMLVHDDVIDHGEVRRGGPTLHVALASHHSESGLAGSDADFGEGMAITLGDLLETVTVESLLEAPAPDRRRIALLQEYRRMARLTAFGQVLDILHSCRPVSEIRENDVLTVHRLKSAIYTVSGPLRLGAILAGGSARLMELLERDGEDYGVAFQLRDDVIGAGLQGDGHPGKSTNDLQEGKRTLLLIKAWERATPEQRASLERVLGNPLATPENLSEALEVIRDTGSLEYSEDQIRRLRERADRRTRSFGGLKPAGRELLLEIGRQLTQRDS
jgi:geranylgeranyl diphosphate synthase type I